jgi:hypothetical protein
VSNRSADFVASFEPVGSKYSARPQVRRMNDLEMVEIFIVVVFDSGFEMPGAVISQSGRIQAAYVLLYPADLRTHEMGNPA